MPTHRERYNATFFSENGRSHVIKIYDKNYSGASLPLKVGGGGVKINYSSKGQDKFNAIMASKCTFSFVVENNVFGVHFQHFVKALRTTYEEGDATVVIWNAGSTAGTPLWSGNILIDLSAKEDVSKPYEVDLTATDGLGLLKNYDMVKTQGAGPYASADTYISDGYQTFIYWIKEILEFCNTPDSDSTDGDVTDYTFSTAVDWWYENHPSADPDISPLAYTKCQMLSAYKVNEDGLYEVKSVYDVLESICKMWGMRVVFWRNRFYFTQLELYNTADVGTYATPDNVESQIWRRDGTFGNGQEYLGTTYFGLYSQTIETNAGGFAGGLQTLAGSKWDYYPKLKEVSVDFQSVSNNNYFITFPQPTTSTTDAIDLITSTPIGTIIGASGFSNFFLNLQLEFNNTSGATQDYWYNFGIRAKPSADSDFSNGYYTQGINTSAATWTAWPGVGTTDFLSQWSSSNYFIDARVNLTCPINPIQIPPGTSQQTIYNGLVPTDSNFTGSWDFEFFTYATIQDLSGQDHFYGHHGQPIGGPHAPDPNMTTIGVSYNDLFDVNGVPVSQFSPVTGATIGGILNQTKVYSARSETEKQEVKNIWWGDTPTTGQPASLIWTDDVGGSGYTDPNGLWRNGKSGAYNKVLAEVLGEARLFNQQQSDLKWSVATAVSEINDERNDGTGTRPVYINPIGKIYDSVDRVYYYMLRGVFNINSDQWEGEWIEVSYNTVSATTTTTGTGGADDTNNNAAARLSGPSNNRRNQALRLTNLSADVAAGTVTSLTIIPLNRNVYGETKLYAQNTIIKEGDKFILEGRGFFHEFTAASDVSDTATSISVDSTTTISAFYVGDQISVNHRDLYQQYQHKTRGTIGGDTIITGVDTDYIKLIPRDFISNDDVANKEWAFDDTGTTGVRIFNASTELWAFVPIPYGKKATHVAVWGNNTKDVEAYELDVNASGIGTALGSGTVGTEFSITNLSSDATNYLGVKVITTGTSNRIYGGKITLANI
tara:strand:- start:94 stop:3087 length:2994 start_codon:yes stop_codon:yes gene_type:complete